MSENPQEIQDRIAKAQSLHPINVAARAGYGPLSDESFKVWHGNSAPCASCGQLNGRDSSACRHCEQDLSGVMLKKMADNSGPWFVYDNLRPFPGVSLDRMLLQIARKVLTRSSIVRGPTTFYQWRFATETPILSKHLGYCWNCQHRLSADERFCPVCKVVLDGRYRSDRPEAPAAGQGDALHALGQAVTASDPPPSLARLSKRGERPLGKAPLIFFFVAVVVVLSIVIMASSSRRRNTTPPPSGESRTSYWSTPLGFEPDDF